MTDTPAILQRNDLALSVVVTESAIARRDSILEDCALIARVSTPEEQETAVEAQKRLRAFLSDVEKSRKHIKDPILTYGKNIDATAKAVVEEVATEDRRLGRLASDYAAAELARVRAAEAARRQELAEAERKREAEVAKAQTLDEQTEIRERYAEQERVAPSVPAPPQVKGQVIKEDWDIVVHDPLALARAYPRCVNITPRMLDVRDLLDQGIMPPGVTAKKVVKSSVRAGREPKAISI